MKAMLARYDLDEIIVIGEAGTDDQESGLDAVPLRHGSALYSADPASFSTYDLLLYRIALFADELTQDRKEDDERLSGEAREKLARFIQRFQEENDELKDRKFNRLFDLLAQNDQIYERFG